MVNANKQKTSDDKDYEINFMAHVPITEQLDTLPDCAAKLLKLIVFVYANGVGVTEEGVYIPISAALDVMRKDNIYEVFYDVFSGSVLLSNKVAIAKYWDGYGVPSSCYRPLVSTAVNSITVYDTKFIFALHDLFKEDLDKQIKEGRLKVYEISD